MDKKPNKQKQTTKHPEDTSNFISNWLFCWVFRVIIKTAKVEITEDELYPTPKKCDAKTLGEELQEIWLKELKHKNPSLTRALIKLFGWEFIIYGFLYFPIDLGVLLFQPLYLKKLLNYYTPNQREITQTDALISASIIAVLAFLRLLMFHKFFAYVRTLGMKMRIACCSIIYKKCLTLKKISLQKVTTGRLINLVSNDVNRFDQAIQYLHFVWIGPAEVLIGAFYINVTIGPTAVYGILIIFFCFLLQIYISKQTSFNTKHIALKTDHRIRLINDFLCGIQIIKMYAWEKPFRKLIDIARNLELKEIIKANYLFILNYSFQFFIIQLVIFVSILAAFFSGFPVTSQYVFAIANIYDNFKISLTVFAPIGVLLGAELRTSILRIQEFLLTDCEKKNSHVIQRKQIGVDAETLDAKWDTSQNNSVLKDINFTASLGELVGIVGAAGSGKSTLLQTLISETEITKGTLSVNGRISYASQEAWIFSASVRQNILFGEEMNQDKYVKVVRACALDHDFSLFPYGDNTLVGERGVMLSGGQKARINLARAIYREADIYLLDDPLSAVDAHVAQIIFQKCIKEYLKKKCVLLVTHQINFLKEATKTYLLKQGHLRCLETVKQILKYSDEVVKKDDEELSVESHQPTEIKEERGNLNAKYIYKTYFSVGGKILFFFVMLTYIGVQLITNCLDYFLSFWLNVKHGSVKFNTDFFSDKNCLLIYCIILFILILTILLNIRLYIKYTTKASSTLHKNMLTNVTHANLEFFHNNRSGRILNRFSSDIGNVDQTIPKTLMLFLSALLLCIGTGILVSVLNYWMIFSLFVLFFIYYYLAILFQPVTKAIKKTEGTSRSPIFSHLTATIHGLSTIKALEAQKILQKEFDDYQNLHTSAFYLVIHVYALLGFWAEFIGAIYSSIVIFSFFLLGTDAYIGSVGLAVHSVLQVIGMVEVVMRMWTTLDTEITCVERILNYTKITSEIGGNKIPPERWPNKGRIVFQSVTLKYVSYDSPVLKNVNLTIEAGEKIGIVGRTGAGKSSLVSTLFCLFPYEGKILIDDVDIKSIPLQNLRSKISIIPQDPVLFLGTLRKNLDPFDEFSDAEVWSALEEVELKSAVKSLESEVLEGGSNFSVGQKQLLCLVRAMLRKTKIVVLDEATANIDLKTDELIQKAIRKKFRKSTVLTVAHRLNTVMGSDRILVMSDGVVVEFGRPSQLLEDTNGYFYKYVMESHKEKHM